MTTILSDDGSMVRFRQQSPCPCRGENLCPSQFIRLPNPEKPTLVFRRHQQLVSLPACLTAKRP